MSLKALVIDLFAGPGGLGEGFSAYKFRNQHPFHIALSVEKEPSAHQTLQLRAFFRQFRGRPPAEYYDYLKDVKINRDQLFAAFSKQSAAAISETMGGPRALGDALDDKLIHRRIKELNNRDMHRVVIGGPPCQAYSLVGRARNLGNKGYRAEADHRHYLYEEYLKVLWASKPEVFVMENVKGILSSKVNGGRVFPRIYEDLSHPGKALSKKGGMGYRIYSLAHDAEKDLFGDVDANYVIKSENYGIPQARHRVILLGVRNDINATPNSLSLCDELTAGDVIGDLRQLRSGLSKGSDAPEDWHKAIAKAGKKVSRELIKLNLDASALDAAIASSLKLKSRGGQFVVRNRRFRGSNDLANWYLDENVKGFLNHETRGHIEEDLARYLFSACYALQKDGMSPRAHDFPKVLAPAHANWKSGKFVDRFKVQVKEKPSSTITSHISKDGHYFIHPDPSQCRSLTVREAARLQTFPDNYFFEGTRTQQYVQVGNAVPPLLAKQIADIVYRVLQG